MQDDNIRNQLVLYARKAYDRRLVGGTGGNFSARLSDGKMAITPSGVSLGDTSLDNLVVVDINTGEWAPVGEFIPSKEYLFHAEIMRLRSDVGAVCHVHSPYATAYAAKKRPIPMVTDAAFKQPPMPSVPFAPSGTRELRENVSRAVQENPACKVLFMEQHGIAALGADVVAAYNVADLTEELAWIAYLSERL
jgi:ribulose-5-phosphate 4-epimerase/fuculose-1-phosphate aldolase